MHVLQKKPIAILAAAALVAFGIMLFSHNKADVDLWGNIGFVRSLPCSDSYHRVNTYSFTEPDHPWTNHEWLAEYVLNRAFVLGGNPLLLILKTLIGFTLTAILFKAMTRTCSSASFRYLFLLLVMSTIGYGFSTRPHLFTYLMLILLLLGLQFNPRMLAILALPAGIIWTNLHGAFFIGIIIVAAYLAGIGLSGLRQQGIPARRNVLLLTVSLLLLISASFINPYGASIWTFIFESAGKTRAYLSEWAPFNPIRDFHDHVDFMALLIVCAFAFTKKPLPSIPWRIIGVLSLAAALLMRRNIPLFALISAFAFAPAVDRNIGPALDSAIRQIPAFLKAAVLILLLSASITVTANNQLHKPLQIIIHPDQFPTGTMQFIKENSLHGNLLVFFDWAEYCIWELYPETRVFLDGRYRSAYSSKTIDLFFDFIYSRAGGERALTDYPTSMVLIHLDNPAFTDMQAMPGWTLVCLDNISGLFLKNESYPEMTAELQGSPVTIDNSSPAVFK
jgi:hypothetical protein